jgi:hypothetical protein
MASVSFVWEGERSRVPESHVIPLDVCIRELGLQHRHYCGPTRPTIRSEGDQIRSRLPLVK